MLSLGFDDLEQRRIDRLREELEDERVPLPTEGPFARVLLAEILYARRAPQHEGRPPQYGALVFEGVPDWDASPSPPTLISAEGVPLREMRRFADGRGSFAVLAPAAQPGLVAFGSAVDDELAAVRLVRTGAYVVQRMVRGTVRVCTGSGVTMWNGSQWLYKPLAEEYLRLVTRLAPHADVAVLGGLLELAVHTLAAARVGATLIWNLDGMATDDRRGGLVEVTRTVSTPQLSVTRRSHFAALRSALSQTDLATVVAADGSIGPIGARLDHTRAAAQLVPPLGGARHTSARRFTYDVPSVLAIVVSASGRVTIMSGGAVAAEIELRRRAHEPLDAARDASVAPSPPAVPCEACGRDVMLVVTSTPRSTALLCPVCRKPLDVTNDEQLIVCGVPVVPGPAVRTTT